MGSLLISSLSCVRDSNMIFLLRTRPGVDVVAGQDFQPVMFPIPIDWMKALMGGGEKK